MENIFMQKLEGLGNYMVDKVVPILVFVVIGILVIGIIRRILRKFLEKSKLEKAAHSLILSLVSVVLYLVLGLAAASGLGINVTGVIALASVLTLAVSLSVQNALTNVIGGFTLLSTQPFHSGDFVEIAGKSGVVREIGMTYTKLVAADNKVISIPNSSVVANDIINFTMLGTRRAEIAVSASYDAPIDKVREALIGACKVEGALEDPAPAAIVASYGDSAITTRYLFGQTVRISFR